MMKVELWSFPGFESKDFPLITPHFCHFVTLSRGEGHAEGSGIKFVRNDGLWWWSGDELDL